MKKRGILFCTLYLFPQLYAEPYHGTVRDFVGINSNVAAYDNGIVGRLAQAAEWMREYHLWEHYEQSPNLYGWDDRTPAHNGNAWPFHTRFVQECMRRGIKMVLCAEGSVKWASPDGSLYGPPYGRNDGTKEEHYRDKAEFIAQAVARYGSHKIVADKLQTADKLSGLGYIQYYEDENEPDQWWRQPTWPPQLYAKYLNAVHDGWNVPPHPDYPLIGIKNVDPTAVHVLGGLAARDISYLDQLFAAADGRIPFDVINFHHYCTSGTSARQPEDELYGFEKICRTFLDWRDQHTPGLPVWLTEFGWDTYQNNQGKGSYVYAGEQAQANYLLRSIFLLMGYGIGKAFVFFDVDPNSVDITQYASCGILTDKAHGLKPKPSFYYLATLKNLLGDYSFEAFELYRSDNPEVFCCRLKAPEANRFCWVLWCRKAKAKTDDGTIIADYRFQKAGLDSVRAVEPIDGSTQGREVAVTPENAGTPVSTVVMTLSEKPTFLFATLNPELSVESGKKPTGFALRVFPNPCNSETTVEYELPGPMAVTLRLFDLHGRTFGSRNVAGEAGVHREPLDLADRPSGVYLVELRAGAQRLQRKVCLIR